MDAERQSARESARERTRESERASERARDTERETERDRERQRERETYDICELGLRERERMRERERERGREGGRKTCRCSGCLEAHLPFQQHTNAYMRKRTNTHGVACRRPVPRGSAQPLPRGCARGPRRGCRRAESRVPTTSLGMRPSAIPTRAYCKDGCCALLCLQSQADVSCLGSGKRGFQAHMCGAFRIFSHESNSPGIPGASGPRGASIALPPRRHASWGSAI